MSETQIEGQMALDVTVPVNRLGATEAEWNEWIAESEAWRAEHPEPKHKPHEVCDCQPPVLRRRMHRGHCAAVGEIVPWADTVGEYKGGQK